MGAHINEQGKFQSDKYPTCPAGKVPMSVEDPKAQPLLWAYAQSRREVDAEFSDDLEACLLAAGYRPPTGEPLVERIEHQGRRLSVTTYHDGPAALTACLTFRRTEDAAACARALSAAVR